MTVKSLRDNDRWNSKTGLLAKRMMTTYFLFVVDVVALETFLITRFTLNPATMRSPQHIALLRHLGFVRWRPAPSVFTAWRPTFIFHINIRISRPHGKLSDKPPPEPPCMRAAIGVFEPNAQNVTTHFLCSLTSCAPLSGVDPLTRVNLGMQSDFEGCQFTMISFQIVTDVCFLLLYFFPGQ